jgi:hypothetical protein
MLDPLKQIPGFVQKDCVKRVGGWIVCRSTIHGETERHHQEEIRQDKGRDGEGKGTGKGREGKGRQGKG